MIDTNFPSAICSLFLQLNIKCRPLRKFVFRLWDKGQVCLYGSEDASAGNAFSRRNHISSNTYTLGKSRRKMPSNYFTHYCKCARSIRVLHLHIMGNEFRLGTQQERSCWLSIFPCLFVNFGVRWSPAVLKKPIHQWAYDATKEQPLNITGGTEEAHGSQSVYSLMVVQW